MVKRIRIAIQQRRMPFGHTGARDDVPIGVTCMTCRAGTRTIESLESSSAEEFGSHYNLGHLASVLSSLEGSRLGFGGAAPLRQGVAPE